MDEVAHLKRVPVYWVLLAVTLREVLAKLRVLHCVDRGRIDATTLLSSLL